MNSVILAVKEIRRRHPIFFWGLSTILLLLLIATVTVAARIPRYQRQAAIYGASMTEAERAARDRILNSRARRSELAIALLQRELRLAALDGDRVHLALSTEDSTLELRHGPTTLRRVAVAIGPDSTIEASDGRTWRLVRALGERHLTEKAVEPALTVPEWVYVSRGEAIPAESDRRVEGGLGRYVLRLDDGTEIHTRPTVGPFAEGSRPAAFIVEDESDMEAMFEALEIDTPVYIY